MIDVPVYDVIRLSRAARLPHPLLPSPRAQPEDKTVNSNNFQGNGVATIVNLT